MKKLLLTCSIILSFLSLSGCKDNTTKNSETKTTSEITSKKDIQALVKYFKENASYKISFQGYEYELKNKLELLDFDNNKYQETDEVYFTITKENRNKLYNDLVETFGTKVTDDAYFNYYKLLDDILGKASSLKQDIVFDLYDYLESDWTEAIVNRIAIENLDEDKVNSLCEAIGTRRIEIAPKSSDKDYSFSTCEFFRQDGLNTLLSGDMSIIATGIAAVIFNTPFTVTEKNPGYSTERYYSYRYMNARVNIKDSTDLKIINPLDRSYYITVKKGADNNTSLVFTLEGCRFINEYDVEVIDTKTQFKVEYAEQASEFTYDATDPNMGIDDNYQGGCYYNIVIEGIDTYQYTYKRTTTFVDGTSKSETFLPDDEYYYGRDEYRLWTKKGYNA